MDEKLSHYDPVPIRFEPAGITRDGHQLWRPVPGPDEMLGYDDLLTQDQKIGR